MAEDSGKRKRQRLLALVLILILTPFVLYNISRYGRRAANRLKAKGEISVSVESSLTKADRPSAPTVSNELEAQEKGLIWKRDPFVLGLKEAEKAPALQLKVSGIIYDENRPEDTYAILNEEVVRIGDNFHGIKIIDIQSDYVRLKKFNQELILHLHQEEEME